MNLAQLAEKYGTDKLQHGYIFYYEKYLPKNPKRLLEIGCLKGASLRMWRDYFPDCELHTIDLFEENSEPDIEGLICHKGNQSDLKVLNGLPSFDIVIDDGSHNAVDIQTSFDFIFKYCMAENGVYVIEDLHCLTIESYRYMTTNGGYHIYMPFEDTILAKMQDVRFKHRFELFDNKIAFIYAE